uniref:FG-GAP repeat domain-containing protein n=1 Tax=Methylomonas sp. SPW-1 TaxID=3438877 RepID=UPI00402B8BAE
MGKAKPTVMAVNRDSGKSGKTELHTLLGNDNFQSFGIQNGTGLHLTDNNWFFTIADWDRDMSPDLIAINRQGSSGSTEIHILSGSSGHQEFILHSATALHKTDLNWDFALTDWNGDGFLDLVAINRNGGSGQTEIHVLSGKDLFQSFIDHIATGLHPTTHHWSFICCDWEQSGKPDLACINRQGGSGYTELHILSAASGWKEFITHYKTSLTHTDSLWSFGLVDWEERNELDLVAVTKCGSSKMVEVHILSKKSNYRDFILQTPTALHELKDEWELLIPTDWIYLEVEDNSIFTLASNNIIKPLLSSTTVARRFHELPLEVPLFTGVGKALAPQPVRKRYYPMNLNRRELKFISNHPIDSLHAYGAALDAIERVRKEFPERSLINGEGDATRHCYWSALLHRDLDNETAGSILENHEYGHEDQYDSHNNKIGRDVVERTGHDISDDQLYKECRSPNVRDQLKFDHRLP